MPERTLSELNALDVVCVSIQLCGHYVLNCSVANSRRGEERREEEGGREGDAKLYSIYSIVKVFCSLRAMRSKD